MKVLVILVFGVNLAYCAQLNGLNGLISPPASDATYSTGYGISNGNSEILSTIKLAEGANNGNGVPLPEVRNLPPSQGVGNIAPSVSTTGNVGIISGSGDSQNINHGVSSVKQLTERVPIPVPQPYPVRITRPVPLSVPIPNPVSVPRPVPIPVPQPVPVTISKPVPVPITRSYPLPIQRPVYVNVPQPLQVPFVQPYPYVIPHQIPVRISTPIAIPIASGIVGPGGIIAGGIPGIHGRIGAIEASGQYLGESFDRGHFGGIVIGGSEGAAFSESALAPGAVEIGAGFIGGGSFSSSESEKYVGQGGPRPNNEISQSYDNNGEYKY